MRISKKQAAVFVFLAVFTILSSTISFPARAATGNLLSSQAGMGEIGAVYGGDPADIRTTVARIINVSLEFIGVIFLGLTIFAGFKYMTAAGNEEKTKEAVGLLRNAIIGLIIILMAWGITRYSIIILDKTVNGSGDYLWYPK